MENKVVTYAIRLSGLPYCNYMEHINDNTELCLVLLQESLKEENLI